MPVSQTTLKEAVKDRLPATYNGVEMFNEHQQAYIEELSKIPPEKKCWCGWYLLNHCPHCPENVSSALKLAIRCPSCNNEPHLVTGIITHRIGCKSPGKHWAFERPGLADHCKAMAEAAVKALGLDFEQTAPSDITAEIARLKKIAWEF